MNLKLTIIYRGINEFKKVYQPRTNIIKDENRNLLGNPQNFLKRWKNFFNQLLNVHAVHDVRQMDKIQLSHLCQDLALLKWKLLL
jgi:hypothetical protein